MESLAVKRKAVIAAAYVYLTLPICIYFVGWLKPVISVPMTLFFIYGTVVAVKNQSVQAIKTPAVTARQFIIFAMIIFLWVLMSGVGGFVWQNRYDHVLRNAVFQDLVHFDWPVVSDASSRTIAYYIGFWMPSALVGKAFGMEAGYFFQLLWALIGTGLAFCLMSYILGKFSCVTLLVFIFFSGLDIIPFLINVSNNGLPAYDAYSGFGIFYHLELQFTVFNSSSPTSMLYWMYNYAIPFWVGFLLLLMQKNNRCLVFTYSLLALFAPIPMVGALPAVVYIMLRNEGVTPKNFFQKFGALFKHQFNLQNIAGLLQVVIIELFLATNNSARRIGMLPVNADSILWFLYFFMVEFGLYLLWLYPAWRKNKLCIVLMCSTAVFSFVEMGGSYDFAWRTTAPFMFFLMLYLIRKLIQKPQTLKLPMKAAIILILLAGAVTPVFEISRSVYNTAVIAAERQSPGTYAQGSHEYDIAQQPMRSDWIPSFVEIEEQSYIGVFDNFVGTDSQDKLFNRYLRK
ncbi:MAG: hypothetical protein ABIK64_08275 [Bacillota bacterium]